MHKKMAPYLPLVPHIWLSEFRQHWFRWWIVAYAEQSHYLYQVWFIVNYTIRNKLQWNFNQNTNLFIHENASKNIVWETVAFCTGVDELNVTLYLLSQRSQISPECNMLFLAQPRGSYCVDESLIKRSCGIGATLQEFNLHTPSSFDIFVYIFFIYS